jgi:hypothetical protein
LDRFSRNRFDEPEFSQTEIHRIWRLMEILSRSPLSSLSGGRLLSSGNPLEYSLDQLIGIKSCKADDKPITGLNTRVVDRTELHQQVNRGADSGLCIGNHRSYSSCTLLAKQLYQARARRRSKLKGPNKQDLFHTQKNRAYNRIVSLSSCIYEIASFRDQPRRWMRFHKPILLPPPLHSLIHFPCPVVESHS